MGGESGGCSGSGGSGGSGSSTAPTEARQMYTLVRGGSRSGSRSGSRRSGARGGIGMKEKEGTVATIVRVDGSAQAKWPHGSGIAVSIDCEKMMNGSIGWRTFVSVLVSI